MKSLKIFFMTWLLTAPAFCQIESIPKAPDREEGDGPYPQLIIRGATLIDGTGSPPRGPIDIVIERNRITQIKSVGSPGVEIDPEKRPEAKEGAVEIDAD